MLLNAIDRLVSAMPPSFLKVMVDHMPDPIVDWKRDASFRDVVRYAYKHSPFYRKRFDNLKIDPYKINKPADLGDFYTTSEDIIANSEDFLSAKPHMIFESSGTTGRNKRVYFSRDEVESIGRFNATGFLLWGLNQDDRLVNAFDFCIWIPGLITQKGIEASGMLGMAAGKIEPMEVYKRIPVYNFNVIFGEPTWLIKLTEIAEKHGSYPLKLIVGGAEGMPEGARSWMKKVWQGANVRMVYASVESGGVMGFEASEACNGYHVDENSFLVEVVDPDSEGYGEVVFTTLRRRTMPLIRYKNRDISKLVTDSCPCGRRYRKLAKMRGRSDEMVVASGGNLYPLMFENILRGIDEITNDWQIIFRHHDIKEVMEFHLELKSDYDRNRMKERVFAGMKDLYPDLWKNFNLKIFEVDFAFHAPGTLRANRKLIRLVDKRYTK